MCDSKKAWQWLLLFCVLHILLWTVASTLFRGSVTHDTLEGIAWGRQWQWGYDKHPFITAWLVAGITDLFGTVGWPVYLLSQITVVIAFVSVFVLAKEIFSPALALISVLLLEGILYHSINTINLTPDTMQVPFWALGCLLFYRAILTGKRWMWITLGGVMACCLLTKYAAVFLYAGMAGVLWMTKEGRQCLRQPGVYWACGVFALLILPHAIWAYQHGFSGITYIQDSLVPPLSSTETRWQHLKSPMKFLFEQAGVLLPLVLMTWPLWRGARKPLHLTHFQKTFFWVIGLTPLFLTLIYAAATGHKMIPRWATPYFFLFGCLSLLILQPDLSRRKFIQCVTTGFAVLVITVGIRTGYYLWSPQWLGNTHSDAFLPNSQIAALLTQEWRQTFKQPLHYVAGSHYLSASLSAYSKDKPIPYLDWSAHSSPWIQESELYKKGALFVWEVSSPDQSVLPQEIRGRFPKAWVWGVYGFKKQLKVKVDPVWVAVAALPPVEGGYTHDSERP